MEKNMQAIDWNDPREAEKRVELGRALFREGYNCSQAVTLAFADVYGVPKGLMARLASSFGGGIGRMRETCGTASGMFMLAGLETASEEASQEAKAKNYAAVQQLAADFKAETGGTILCRELLKGCQTTSGSTPEPRSAEYYKKRPCIDLVEMAIRLYINYLRNITK